MEASGREQLLAVLCFSTLAVCVLGRPQSSSASPQHSTVEVVENSSLQGSDHSTNLGILYSDTPEVPWRRSLKRKHHNGGLHFRSGGGGGGFRGGTGGLNPTYSIIVVMSIVAFALLLIAFLCWCGIKKRKNPNWRPTDCVKRKRNKLPREKMITPVQSDVDRS